MLDCLLRTRYVFRLEQRQWHRSSYRPMIWSRLEPSKHGEIGRKGSEGESWNEMCEYELQRIYLKYDNLVWKAFAGEESKTP